MDLGRVRAFCPHSPYTKPLLGVFVLCLNLLDWSPCHHFLLSMSCTITDTPTHHTDLERRGSVQVKATAALLIPNPAQ